MSYVVAEIPLQDAASELEAAGNRQSEDVRMFLVEVANQLRNFLQTGVIGGKPFMLVSQDLDRVSDGILFELEKALSRRDNATMMSRVMQQAVQHDANARGQSGSERFQHASEKLELAGDIQEYSALREEITESVNRRLYKKASEKQKSLENIRKKLQERHENIVELLDNIAENEMLSSLSNHGLVFELTPIDMKSVPNEGHRNLTCCTRYTTSSMDRSIKICGSGKLMVMKTYVNGNLTFDLGGKALQAELFRVQSQFLRHCRIGVPGSSMPAQLLDWQSRSSVIAPDNIRAEDDPNMAKLPMFDAETRFRFLADTELAPMVWNGRVFSTCLPLFALVAPAWCAKSFNCCISLRCL